MSYASCLTVPPSRCPKACVFAPFLLSLRYLTCCAATADTTKAVSVDTCSSAPESEVEHDVDVIAMRSKAGSTGVAGQGVAATL